jgi:hypothetical protein
MVPLAWRFIKSKDSIDRMKQSETYIIFILVCLNALIFLFWKNIENFQAGTSGIFTYPYNGFIVDGDIKIIIETALRNITNNSEAAIIDTKTNKEVWNKTDFVGATIQSNVSTYAIITYRPVMFALMNPPLPATILPTLLDTSGTKILSLISLRTATSYVDLGFIYPDFTYVNGILIQPKIQIPYNDTVEKDLLKLFIITGGGSLPNSKPPSLDIINFKNPSFVLDKKDLVLDTSEKYIFMFNNFFQFIPKLAYGTLFNGNQELKSKYTLIYPIYKKPDGTLNDAMIQFSSPGEPSYFMSYSQQSALNTQTALIKLQAESAKEQANAANALANQRAELQSKEESNVNKAYLYLGVPLGGALALALIYIAIPR